MVGIDDLLKLETNERKNISIWMMFGGSVVFTVFSGICLWLLAANATYVLYLAILAHLQMLTIMTGFIAMLVKRRISANKDGVSIEDSTNDDSSTTTTVQVQSTN